MEVLASGVSRRARSTGLDGVIRASVHLKDLRCLLVSTSLRILFAALEKLRTLFTDRTNIHQMFLTYIRKVSQTHFCWRIMFELVLFLRVYCYLAQRSKDQVACGSSSAAHGFPWLFIISADGDLKMILAPGNSSKSVSTAVCRYSPA